MSLLTDTSITDASLTGETTGDMTMIQSNISPETGVTIKINPGESIIFEEDSQTTLPVTIDNDDPIAVALAKETAEQKLMEKDHLLKDFYDIIFYNMGYQEALNISRHQRTNEMYYVVSLSYSEINFFDFKELFLKLYQYGFRRDSGGRFVDIGSGRGNIVLASVLFHNFNTCIGIEILSSLHKISEQLTERWNKLKIKSVLSRKKKETDIYFYLGDATAIDWSDGDVVFINATCFSDELMSKFTTLALDLKPGSFIIILTKTIISEVYELMYSGEVNVSWGKTIAYIYQRLDKPFDGEVTDRQFLFNLGIRLNDAGRKN